MKVDQKKWEAAWEEIKDQPAEVLFKLVKDVIRLAREKDGMDELRGLICTLLELLHIQRQIEELEKEAATIHAWKEDSNANADL